MATTNSTLATTTVHAFLQGASINTLQTCLGGIQNALGQITADDNDRAAKDISAVAGPSTRFDGGTTSGLVYPFDFPDPDVIPGGTELLRLHDKFGHPGTSRSSIPPI